MLQFLPAMTIVLIVLRTFFFLLCFALYISCSYSYCLVIRYSALNALHNFNFIFYCADFSTKDVSLSRNFRIINTLIGKVFHAQCNNNNYKHNLSA